MARRKKPTGETPEQAVERRQKESIANVANRSEKTSWNRKMENMVKLLAKIRPIEQKILNLHREKLPLLDEVHELRQTMVNECVHPFDQLIVKEDHVLCKFCNRKLKRSTVAQNADSKAQT